MNFDPLAMCHVLADEGVDFVLVGGFAATIHGSTLLTEDIDIVPSRDQENLDRLSMALKRMNAHATTVPLDDTLRVRVAAIDDIIESKRAAGRPKDVSGVIHLESLKLQLEQAVPEPTKDAEL